MTTRTLGTGIVAGCILLVSLPSPVAAHGLVGRVDSPLPLAVYLAGAAVAVALSFAIAFAYTGRWRPSAPERVRHVPRVVVLLLRAIGLVAWAWIVAQVIIGGRSDAEVGSLFTWVYGWVGLALVSALLGPIWSWLDPFSTIHDIGAWILRRIGASSWRAAPYPARWATWPAVGLFTFFVWLELVLGSADMGLVVVGYTIVTLAGMAQFGKDGWRRHGEVFSVWFGLLGRLAWYAPAGAPQARTVRRQHFPDGLLGRPWDASLVALTAIATGAILFDGLSQTKTYFDLVGLPGLAASTLLLGVFLALIAVGALWVGRRVGMAAMGAGLLPISVGYLLAHYLTFLLGDGQRIFIAVSDPLQLGWDLLGTAFFEPSMDWLPGSLLWTITFTAVVGGHVLGAWAGHLGARRGGQGDISARRAQLPLAVIMVALTTVTLWSLGQNVIVESTEDVQVPDLVGASIVDR